MQSFDEMTRGHPFLQGLAPNHAAFLVECGHPVHFAAGETIRHEAQEAKEFCLIHSGTVALETRVPGRGPIRIQTIGPGEVLGWSWLFEPYQWHFEALAIDAVSAIAIDGVRVRLECTKDYEFGYHMMQRFAQLITQRLQATRLQLIDLYAPYP